eukprot:m.257342 g.257342  ORF g.257342 m.257342 type:complete len:323 (-) comp11031_c0_seq1:180-1148(-)
MARHRRSEATSWTYLFDYQDVHCTGLGRIDEPVFAAQLQHKDCLFGVELRSNPPLVLHQGDVFTCGDEQNELLVFCCVVWPKAACGGSTHTKVKLLATQFEDVQRNHVLLEPTCPNIRLHPDRSSSSVSMDLAQSTVDEYWAQHAMSERIRPPHCPSVANKDGTISDPVHNASACPNNAADISNMYSRRVSTPPQRFSPDHDGFPPTALSRSSSRTSAASSHSTYKRQRDSPPSGIESTSSNDPSSQDGSRPRKFTPQRLRTLAKQSQSAIETIEKARELSQLLLTAVEDVVRAEIGGHPQREDLVGILQLATQLKDALQPR